MSNNAVQLSPPTGKAVDLVGSAAVVWAVLEEPRTLAAVTREAFELDPVLDEYQVRTILESLVAQRLVARDAADSAGTGDVAV